MDIFENAKSMKRPVLIHVKTKKGKGYDLAEKNPSFFHGIAPFNITTGEIKNPNTEITFSAAFGTALCKLALKQENIVAIAAAMPDGTGLLQFAKTYPKRFFDVGIAEQHAVTFAAGLATEGYRPVVAIYSSFLQRAYDQILHDVCLQNLPVIFAIDRAGLVGEDGATHQGIYDIAYLSSMPNITLLSPKMPEEIEGALKYALTLEGPVAIRYPRGFMQMDSTFINSYRDVSFKTLKEGNNIAIIAAGRMVELALTVRQTLSPRHNVAVIEAPCLYPFNDTALQKIASTYNYIFTIEDGILAGGFGEKVFSHFIKCNNTPRGQQFGYKNGMIEHGDIKSLLIREGLEPEAICNEILTILQKENQ